MLPRQPGALEGGGLVGRASSTLPKSLAFDQFHQPGPRLREREPAPLGKGERKGRPFEWSRSILRSVLAPVRRRA
jgi:hypothetical protein